MESKVVEGGFFWLFLLLPHLFVLLLFANLYLMPIHKLYCYIMVSHYPLLTEHH